MTTTSTADCTLTDNTCERPRFYPRQIVTADDLTLDQTYFVNKSRRHNRNLHGWGIVCGGALDYSTKPWMVVVKSGYVLGPYGDEIVVCKDVCFDVRTRCVTATPGSDPCADVWQPSAPTAGTTTSSAIIAIEYAAIQTRPVRVNSAGCGCQENQCEASRCQDSYRICVLDAVPASHNGDPRHAPTLEGTPPACPAPSDPWVVLGTVALQPDGTVTQISYAHRHQVVSYAPCWWQPTDPGPNPNVTK